MTEEMLPNNLWGFSYSVHFQSFKRAKITLYGIMKPVSTVYPYIGGGRLSILQCLLIEQKLFL